MLKLFADVNSHCVHVKYGTFSGRSTQAQAIAELQDTKMASNVACNDFGFYTQLNNSLKKMIEIPSVWFCFNILTAMHMVYC